MRVPPPRSQYDDSESVVEAMQQIISKYIVPTPAYHAFVKVELHPGPIPDLLYFPNAQTEEGIGDFVGYDQL